MSPITEVARKLIDDVQSAGPLYDEAYAQALHPDAVALKQILGRNHIVEAVKRYHAADKRAMRAQALFVFMGRVTAYTGFLAAVLGGVLLYIGSAPESEIWLLAIGITQFVSLAISLMGSLVLYSFNPLGTWRQERGEAEAERIGVFARIMSERGEGGGDHGKLLLPLQLECFRRHLVEDQREFFVRRGSEHRRNVFRAQILRALALALIVVASLPLLAKLQPFAWWLPDWVRMVMAWVPLDGRGVPEMYALGGLVGGALQGLLAALGVISLSERNAGKYERMAERLNDYCQNKLEPARAAAAGGDGLLVGEFARQVACDLAAEASEWVAVQEALASITLARIADSHKLS